MLKTLELIGGIELEVRLGAAEVSWVVSDAELVTLGNTKDLEDFRVVELVWLMNLVVLIMELSDELVP